MMEPDGGSASKTEVGARFWNREGGGRWNLLQHHSFPVISFFHVGSTQLLHSLYIYTHTSRDEI
jgi:hypothetical protein